MCVFIRSIVCDMGARTAEAFPKPGDRGVMGVDDDLGVETGDCVAGPRPTPLLPETESTRVPEPEEFIDDVRRNSYE